MFSEGKIVILSDHIKYIVVKAIYGENVNYYYVYKLVEDEKVFKILKEENGKFSIVDDPSIKAQFIEIMN
ncbi:MAG: hypothetical protein IJB98_01085 [Clostridia bacterium]|nr:hypothetical protein [Clostridia bacterium]